jgi:hypothetical protein
MAPTATTKLMVNNFAYMLPPFFFMGSPKSSIFEGCDRQDQSDCDEEV